MMVAFALSTEVSGGPPPAGPGEINKSGECPIKVNMKLTADNNFNLFVGNKLRITKFITSSNNWKNQICTDFDLVCGQYIYVMAWNNKLPCVGNF